MLAKTCAPVQDNSLCEKEFLRVGLSFWTGPRPGDRDLVSTLDLHTAASVGDTDFILQMCEQVVGFSVFYLLANTVGAVRNETLFFINFSAQDASILKISVPIFKRSS